MSRSRSRLWDDIHDPRLADLVRASTVGEAAALQPLVVSPAAPTAASSHRTSRTDRDQQSFGVSTPMGRTSRFRQPY